MGFISQIFGYPLGWIMYAIYFVVRNYGVALILFTLLTKILMFPLAVKQQKSTARMAAFQPKMEKLRQKYGNNKQKYQEEMAKLYTEEGYNPMSGCLPLLIQFPILFGLIDVVYRPLTHIARMSSEMLESAKLIAEKVLGSALPSGQSELYVLKAFQQDPTQFSQLGDSIVGKLQSIDMNFLGLDFGATPTWAFNLLLLIPILSGLTSLALSFYSMHISKKNALSVQAQQMNGMSKGMMIVMPLMSFFIAFSVPAGVGFYWMVSNVFGILQAFLLNKLYNPKVLAQKIQEEMEEAKKKKKTIVVEEVVQDEDGDQETLTKEQMLSQKEINRRRLAEARKRDAEKYGEEYVEVTDDDLI